MDPLKLKCAKCTAVTVFFPNTQTQVCCKEVYQGVVCHSRVFFTVPPPTPIRLR